MLYRTLSVLRDSLSDILRASFKSEILISSMDEWSQYVSNQLVHKYLRVKDRRRHGSRPFLCGLCNKLAPMVLSQRFLLWWTQLSWLNFWKMINWIDEGSHANLVAIDSSIIESEMILKCRLALENINSTSEGNETIDQLVRKGSAPELHKTLSYAFLNLFFEALNTFGFYNAINSINLPCFDAGSSQQSKRSPSKVGTSSIVTTHLMFAVSIRM